MPWPLALSAALGTAAEAEPACQASVTMVDFGRVEHRDDDDITGRLTVTCDGPTGFEVKASPGYGSYQGRTMIGPKGRVLRYNLYVDAARRRVWGDGEAGTATIAGQSDGRKAVSFTVYGRIPKGQPAGSGRYRDSVEVSVAH